jgi:hypothetical protein
MLSIRRAAIAVAAIALPLHPLVAQHTLVVPGSDTDDRARFEEILGQRSLDGALLRSASTRLPDGRALLLTPELRLVVNSGLPYSLNQGSLWAGVGTSALIRFGALLRFGHVTIVAAPEITWAQNRSFTGPDTTLWPVPAGLSRYASPFYYPPRSADLPWRFGGSACAKLWWGQSSVTASLGPVAVGVTAEDEWWGPGIRNALVLGNNAPGIPRLFIRTARPIRTPFGEVEGLWFVGGLSESAYFDTLPGNDVRSVAAFALVWRPRWEPDLAIGLTRAVYRSAGGWDDILLRFGDVFSATARADTGAAPNNTGPRAEGMTGLFARWVFPSAGAEAYLEWARNELPRSLRDLLTSPGHSQAYTVGFQWTRPAGPRRWRVQAEVTDLEKDPSYRDQPVRSWYISRVVPQGYTNDGRVVGAAIGPGGSSQWLALDVLAASWRAGVFLSRIRWDDDALYDLPQVPPLGRRWCSHDVSFIGGLRGGVVGGRLGSLSGSAALSRRLNPYYENYTLCPYGSAPGSRRSVTGLTLEIRYAPPGP